MATTYTITLTNNFESLATYTDAAISITKNSSTSYTLSPKSITPPVWTSGYKTFDGYYSDVGYHSINADGTYNFNSASKDSTLTESWTNLYQAEALIYSSAESKYVGEIVYNGGAWYSDIAGGVLLDSSHPITIPTRTQYRFLGCYSTNNTSGTLYINPDGTPTAAFLALAPTSDITIYAQWEQVSYKVTVSHSSGSPTSTVFYAKIGETGSGRFYSDDLCTTSISSITPPTRELYRWEGAWSTTWTSSSAVQYITTAGAFTSALYALSITADKTLSYSNNWTQVSVKLTIYNNSSWTFETKTYYIDKTNGGVYADWFLTTPLTSLPIPVRAGYRFLGYYSTNATTGTLYVAADGTIQSALQARTAATTIYAQGVAASVTLTLDDNGGSGGDGTIYYESTNQKWFNPESKTITKVSVPTRDGYVFQGYYYGSLCIASADGTIQSVSLSSGITATARWQHIDATVNVNAGEGSGGTSVFYYNGADGLFYSDAAHTTQITSVTLPSKSCHACNGLYDADSNQIVDSSGVIDSTWLPSASTVTLTATFTRTCYKMTLDHDGGTSSVSAIYRAVGGSVWYSDESLATQITSVAVPTYTGYTFGGYAYNSTTVANSSGTILSAATIDADYTATAAWTVKRFTITFNANGGSCSESTRSVQEGQPVGTLPTPTRTGYDFDGWFDAETGGNEVTSSTVVSAAATYYAHWTTISYAITYVLNGGTNHASNPSSYTVEDSVTLQNPTRDNYVFAGWTPTDSIPSGSVGARTFTATWTQIVYKTKPTAASGLVYNGGSQTGVTFDSSLSYTGDVSATNAGSYSATFSLPADTSSAAYRWSDGSTGTVAVSWSISALAVTSASVTFDSIPDQYYSGSEISPSVTMYFNGAVKTQGTDYTLSYSNNINVGTATVIVTGTGNFTGTKNISFKIVYNVSVVSISIPTAASGLVYDGSSHLGVPSYDSRLTPSGTLSATAAGRYTATFTLPSSTSTTTYQWSDGTTTAKSIEWTISPLTVSSSSVTFDAIADQAYTGSAITPSVAMYFGGSACTQGTDYTVAYSNNTSVGTATATVTGIGNFTGTKNLSFNIVKGTISITTPTALSPTYNGSQQTGVSYDSRLSVSGTVSATAAGQYTATFSLPSSTSTSTYKWSDGTTASKSVTWNLAQLAISSSSVTFAAIPAQTYTGSPITPTVSATFNGTALVQGTDFSANYSNNTNIGTANVTCSGTGNFTGTKSLTFQIVAPESRVVTFDGNGGTPSEPSRTVTDGSPIGTLPTATRTGYDLLGWYTAASGGTAIDSTMTITSNETFYAHWQAVSYTINYVLNGGTNAASNPSTYTIEDAVTLAAPTRDGYTFTGWSPDGGVIAVGSTGAKTFTASWTSSTVYTVTFNANGGYCSESSRSVPEDEQVGTLPTPTRTGFMFGGWWTADSGGSQISATTTIDDDVIFYAHWTANSYTLYFDANGGSTSTSSKTVTFGQAIGTLPTPTRTGHTFGFWKLNGVEITSATVWTYESNMTAYAEWDVSFGYVTDYFNLSSSNLIPESSDSGDTHQHTCAYNATSESPATETSGIWRNPRVTYRVANQMTLNITLGAAFAAVNSGSSAPTISGYMISAVEVHTAVGEAPSVTVSAVANEGFTQRQSGSTTYYTATATPAIKTYAVSIPISPRHRPQNLLSAINGGGELQELTLIARGDPVVVAEKGMPCASDMTHGHIEVTARTAAYNNESAPTAGGGFTKTAEPQSGSGTGYKTYSVTVRKELV